MMALTETQDASDRLNADVRGLETAARRIMDSIAGAWECEGRPFVPEICSAAQTIVEATGRLGVALEKAALEISTRAPECYIDRTGTANATEPIRDIAASLLAVATTLKNFPQHAHSHIRGLGSIGERE